MLQSVASPNESTLSRERGDFCVDLTRFHVKIGFNCPNYAPVLPIVNGATRFSAIFSEFADSGGFPTCFTHTFALAGESHHRPKARYFIP